ncbi:MAG: hypothetical protein KC502_01855 [Myxococcales bacterium]|nr:hypothetical protein [Myxococcales bacterium]
MADRIFRARKRALFVPRCAVLLAAVMIPALTFAAEPPTAEPAKTAATPSTQPAAATTPSPKPASSAEASKAAMAALSLANHHYKGGRFKKAAKLYHEAYGIDARAAFLFNAARAEMRGFAHVDAKRDFERYMALPTATDKGKQRARLHLSEIEAYQKRMAAAQAKTVAATASANAARRPLTKMTLGLWIGGGVLVAGSAIFYGVAAGARGQTNEMDIKTEDDKEEHNTRVRSETSLRNMSVLMLVGGAGLGFWGWRRASARRSTPKTASLQVTPWLDGQGFSLVGRF